MEDRIPPHAKKVFSGIRTDIYQWEQEMYDGSYATFERARFIDGSFTIAITPDKKILLLKQEQPSRRSPFIGLPGGAFDFPDEDPLICAKRELLEETGYVSDEWELYFVSEGSSNIIAYTYFYLAFNIEKKQDIVLDPGERIESFFLDFDSFLLLSEDPRFVHWTLVPHLFQARIHTHEYEAMKKRFRL